MTPPAVVIRDPVVASALAARAGFGARIPAGEDQQRGLIRRGPLNSGTDVLDVAADLSLLKIEQKPTLFSFGRLGPVAYCVPSYNNRIHLRLA